MHAPGQPGGSQVSASSATHRQHVQAKAAVLQLAQQLERQLLLKLAQGVLVRPQAQLKRLKAGREVAGSAHWPSGGHAGWQAACHAK